MDGIDKLLSAGIPVGMGKMIPTMPCRALGLEFHCNLGSGGLCLPLRGLWDYMYIYEVPLTFPAE